MAKLKEPKVRIEYQGKDITNDLSGTLIAFTYSDAEEGESDELSLTLSDKQGLWKGPWYPSKRDKIRAWVGYDEAMMFCGEFVVDSIDFSGPPEQVDIRALAAATSSPLRTKRSTAFEAQSLRQIVEQVAARQGLEVVGEIADIQFGRITQNRKSDLEFLRDLAHDYGHAFSVRGSKLIFTKNLEDGDAVLTLSPLDLSSYRFSDATMATFKAASVSFASPATGGTFAYTTPEAEGETSSDTLEIRARAENQGQAQTLAESAIKNANKNEAKGSFSTAGKPILVAGVNIILEGLGKIGGRVHITRSVHTVTRAGYTTQVEFYRVTKPTAAQQTPKPTPKAPTKFIYTS